MSLWLLNIRLWGACAFGVKFKGPVLFGITIIHQQAKQTQSPVLLYVLNNSPLLLYPPSHAPHRGLEELIFQVPFRFVGGKGLKIPGLPSHFHSFQGSVFLFRTSKTQGKQIRFLKRTMVEKNGESTPRDMSPTLCQSNLLRSRARVVGLRRRELERRIAPTWVRW